MFDTYAMVDWSAAGVRRTGRDSIWICWVEPDGERVENPGTRHEARTLLADRIAAAQLNGERVLVGFDFPFGYPAGFAASLGLEGSPWRAAWDEIARLIEDREDNANNRFRVGAELNRRISGQRFPFWGCPAQFQHEFLGPKHYRSDDNCGLAERRLIDLRMPGAQPCWKLAYAGSVGSQSLTGIPVVRALRDDPRWDRATRIWPFETGLRPPGDADVVFAEVYPSLWKSRIAKIEAHPKDKAQVRFVARFFAERDRAGELMGLFLGDCGLSRAQRRLVETEEAWTLGVTKPK